MLQSMQKVGNIFGNKTKKDFDRFSVVRNMITLKYGDKAPVNQQLIAEVSEGGRGGEKGEERKGKRVGVGPGVRKE
jgi:hypothetical protein